MIFLTLGLISYLSALIIGLIYAHDIENNIDSFWNTKQGYNVIFTLDYLKGVFTLIAFILDLYKWLLFLTTSNDAENENSSSKYKKFLLGGLIIC